MVGFDGRRGSGGGRQCGAAPAAGALRPAPVADRPASTAITRGPKFHWFGYYDKLQFDPDRRYCSRAWRSISSIASPRADDVDPASAWSTWRTATAGSSWAKAAAWCWQQGCMLQWLPGIGRRDHLERPRRATDLVCHILDVRLRQRADDPPSGLRVQPRRAVGRVAPTSAACSDVRPGYGYAGLAGSLPHPSFLPKPRAFGSSTCESGQAELIVSLAEPQDPLRGRLDPGARNTGSTTCCQPRRHAISSSCTAGGSRARRASPRACSPPPVTASTCAVIDPSGLTSHFIWRRSETHPGLVAARLARRQASTCSRTRRGGRSKCSAAA